MKLEVMLDSGAYTVWKKGKAIDLHAYANFIIKYKDVWTTVVNLDVIPDDPSEAERAADQGWENYYELKRILEQHGITPIHVFHRGDNIKHLKRLVDECEYFGLAPKTNGSTPARDAFLDWCMPHVTDDSGWPIRKLHGFAVTAPELIRHYPWYSVDSSSWQQAGRHGSCYIPGYGQIAFSAKSSKRLKFGQHFDSYPAADREVIAAYLRSKGIAHPRMLRDNYCLTCGKDFDGKVRHDRLIAPTPTPQPPDDGVQRTRIFFAGNTGTAHIERLLVARGARRRLLSFASVEPHFYKTYLPVYREHVSGLAAPGLEPYLADPTLLR